MTADIPESSVTDTLSGVAASLFIRRRNEPDILASQLVAIFFFSLFRSPMRFISSQLSA
ncbi:hypothetical protein VSX61_13190 [Brenneria populi subsp. brevivirga]|uniref:hypothetical protein n=1 Tax=Brenneria populi TaxID=1505588 RepID=UPI002E19B94C|nr:hypothetical protein [Brenneria populi subsp. brevivirga]